VGVQALVGAVAQARVHGPSLVGAVEHFVKALVDHERQPLATVFGVAAQGWPTAGHVLLVGGLETAGRAHLVRGFVQRATLLVAAEVERKRHLGGKFSALFEHRIEGIDIGVGVRRASLERINGVQHFVQNELHVAQRRGVSGHETGLLMEKDEGKGGQEMWRSSKCSKPCRAKLNPCGLRRKRAS